VPFSLEFLGRFPLFISGSCGFSNCPFDVSLGNISSATPFRVCPTRLCFSCTIRCRSFLDGRVLGFQDILARPSGFFFQIRLSPTRTDAAAHCPVPLARLPPAASILNSLDAETNRKLWEMWQEGLSVPISLPQTLPTLRMLLIWDNLRGHYTTDMVLWLFEHGIMPLYTPLGGSWLNMAESMQRILFQRGLAGQCPESTTEIISSLEAVARAWNQEPSPFEWGGKRAARRQRSRQRKHALGGSGAYTHRPIHRRPTIIQNWQRSCQTTH
jgi:hypothetical protein